jgi:NAD(P)-dependent dehydrogenase (short-subunit alcohol dehydrogenase family)
LPTNFKDLDTANCVSLENFVALILIQEKMHTKSKIALVTGGSRGLGKDMVLKLAQKGHDIIFTYHSNKVEADKVLAEVRAMGRQAEAFQLDVSNLASFDAFVDKVTAHLQQNQGSANIDFLVNNAGSGLNNTIAATTEEQFDAMLNVHFKGVYFFTQKWLPFLNDGGRIINISSGLTRFSFVGMSAYACMKGAVETFTKYLAKELGPRKITANTVAPGAIATDFAGGSNRTDEGKRNIISSLTALGRVGEAEDVGGVVAFLCSSDAGWVNGQRIEVSGGMLV